MLPYAIRHTLPDHALCTIYVSCRNLSYRFALVLLFGYRSAGLRGDRKYRNGLELRLFLSSTSNSSSAKSMILIKG